MDRKTFIKSCGMVCLSGTSFMSLLQSCGSIHLVKGNIEGDDLVIPVQDFELKKGEEIRYKKYLVVEQEILQYPICVYRFSEHEYSALWMRCTHQGTELQVFGDKLLCPAHGSEFDAKGGVQNGPADKTLRTFPVRFQDGLLKISLKAIG